jgi:hypothetical protein
MTQAPPSTLLSSSRDLSPYSVSCLVRICAYARYISRRRLPKPNYVAAPTRQFSAALRAHSQSASASRIRFRRRALAARKSLMSLTRLCDVRSARATRLRLWSRCSERVACCDMGINWCVRLRSRRPRRRIVSCIVEDGDVYTSACAQPTEELYVCIP